MKAPIVKEAISKSVSSFIGFCLYLFGTIFIGIFPDKAQEILGEKIVVIYNYFSTFEWTVIGLLIFIVIFIFNLISTSKKETNNFEKTQRNESKNIEVNQIGNSNIGKQSANTINNYFDHNEISKNNLQNSTIETEKIVFRRMYYYKDLIIEGSSPEQIINSIVENISSSLWYIHTKGDTIAYDIDHNRSKAYNPSIDNTDAHGIIFYGLRYDLEKREGGILIRKNMRSIPNIFTISIVSSGFGSEIKLKVMFNTQIEEALEFFDKLTKFLRESQIFKIKEKRKSRIG